MQLFWVSGSTGAIKQINITKERLTRVAVITGASFLLLGILIFSTGIHIALEVSPDFAREVSGVVTVKERMALDNKYAKQLKSIQDQLARASMQFNELKSIKDRYLAISTPYTIKNKLLNQCWKMWHSCVITWDGSVVPCCFDKDASHTMGSLQNESFATVWNNDQYQHFRAHLLKSREEIEICKNCTEGTKVWESN